MTKRRQKDRTHIHRLLAMSRGPNEKSIRVPINALRAETLSHWRTTDDDSGDGLDNLEEHSTAHEKKTHKRSTLMDIVSWGFLEKRSRLVYQNFCTHSGKKETMLRSETTTKTLPLRTWQARRCSVLEWKRKREEKRDTWNYRNYQIDRRAFGEVCVILFSIQYISSGLVSARDREVSVILRTRSSSSSRLESDELWWNLREHIYWTESIIMWWRWHFGSSRTHQMGRW